MKLTLVLRDKKNALKLSTRSIESFIPGLKKDENNQGSIYFVKRK